MKVVETGGTRGTTLSGRLAQLRRSAAEIAAAPSILVVGGGPVGVELAAEVAVAFPSKSVTLLSAASTLMQGLPPALGVAAGRWLTRSGVRVVLGQRVVAEPTVAPEGRRVTDAEALPDPSSSGAGHCEPSAGSVDAGTVLTDAGVRFPAALIFTCAGAAPASAFCSAAESAPALAAALDARGRIRVDLCLRVVGCGPTLFAIGDVAAHPSGEPMLAHTAEKHAAAVAETLTHAIRAATAARAVASPSDAPAAAATAAADEPFARAIAAAPLAQYPRALTGAASAPVIVAVSLGPYEALLAFDGVTVTGPVGRRAAAALKRVIEVTKVSQLLGGAAGGAFWRFSDVAANVLHARCTRLLGELDACC